MHNTMESNSLDHDFYHIWWLLKEPFVFDDGWNCLSFWLLLCLLG